MKKTRSEKTRDTVPLSMPVRFSKSANISPKDREDYETSHLKDSALRDPFMLKSPKILPQVCLVKLFYRLKIWFRGFWAFIWTRKIMYLNFLEGLISKKIRSANSEDWLGVQIANPQIAIFLECTVILFSSRYLFPAKSICPTCKQAIPIFMRIRAAGPPNSKLRHIFV